MPRPTPRLKTGGDGDLVRGLGDSWSKFRTLQAKQPPQMAEFTFT
jgi:hypothetical protein